ncbi:hypothetical protein [Coleofasciculus sp. FACHB-1120]|uniref:hypothetical protein n=1 Tax=Coleofasciculus sp. FACHB-1120 TaxID=2692783 RepID=UPI001684CC4F|nr:hypothetical protein [Coleofasciculus sp. FACHB-1120]MBD2740956.1 hypothetical protein [Coleofasciculus sp. FACHB-1120]
MKVLATEVFSGYTDNTGTPKSGTPKSLGTVTGVMSNYFRLAGIATLLIGLQLFSPQVVSAKINPNLANNSPSDSFWSAEKTQNSLKSGRATKAFEPKDNGPPPNDGAGAGTR